MYEDPSLFLNFQERLFHLQGRHSVRIEYIEGYNILPKIEPFKEGQRFFFKEGGMEVVVKSSDVENPSRTGEREFGCVLVDVDNQNIVYFSYKGDRETFEHS
ncbi:hypothetical protein K8R47_01620 [archaeon]|nr:hypothetical protein [archaeon]